MGASEVDAGVQPAKISENSNNKEMTESGMVFTKFLSFERKNFI
jgi:hypothetical protein